MPSHHIGHFFFFFNSWTEHVFENCTVKLLLLFCICSYICILFFENSTTELLSFFPNKIRHTPSPQANYLACVLCNNTFPAISIEFQSYM